MSQNASVVESRKSEPRKDEAPQGEQRDGLRSLLRGLSFAQQEEALKPGGTPPPGAPPPPPKDKLARLLALVPTALEGIGDTEAGTQPSGTAPKAERPKEDGAEKESQELEQAEQLLDESDAPDDPAELVEVDAESDSPEMEVEETLELLDEPELAEPELAPEAQIAPVQMKAKPGAKKPAPKAAPKPAAKKAAPKAAKKPAPKAAPKVAKAGPKPLAPKAGKKPLTAKNTTSKTAPKSASSQAGLDAAGCRAAYRWTMRQGFATVPFIVRRYQRFLNMPADGKVEGNWKFVQAIAAFQIRQGIRKVDGKLAGATATRMRELLQKRSGLDKKNLLTAHEVGMAQKKNVAAIKNKQHPLSWKVVRELRKLLDMKEEGGLNGPFLRKVAEFQRKHELGYSAQLTGKTINTMRTELNDDINKKIVDAALAYEGSDTSAGPDGGNLACAWAVNKVLKNAIGRTVGSNTNLVSSVESGLRPIGTKVDRGNVKPGDIVIAPNSHIGIATSRSSVLSNSSSRASFSWHSDLDFDGEYGVACRFWRITKVR